MNETQTKVTERLTKEMKKEDPEFETQITLAMRARVGHFKEQADLLTLEGVRRALEKDLGLDKYALDTHKRFIKQCLQECFDASSDENVSKSSGETVEEVVHSTKDEKPDLSEKLQPHKELKELEDEKDMQGSPVLGLLAGDETTQIDTEKAEGVQSEKALSEDTIRETIRKRASYFRSNSETLSMVGARRLLEEDLKLDKNALDSYKKFISEQLDKVMQIAEPANGVKNKRPKKDSHGKVSKKVSCEGSSESLEIKDEVDEEEVKPKKKIASKEKTKTFEGLKNRKRLAEETKKLGTKRKRPVESMSEESNDGKDGGDLSEDDHSQSSVEEPVKKKSEALQKKSEASTPQVYGKRVEHLKSVIKSCGMGVPPSVYKRAKQAPESKREAYLIKELEEILRKEGLSTNPSEKEIKAVKKQKERTKELEGIDLSNIVSSSRRRSTSSFVVPPKPKVPVESDDDDDVGEGDGDEDDSDDEDEDDSDSEGLNDDVEDESD